ncbi:hypothetical protein TARUN_99 [Trichoderma arundinaceum]|uniref:EDC4-like protein pdc1 beta-propeller domain-containing protein n=1 Tax=Trichoderma arundinaceum TaxID=490622 RepID=A0A395P2C5_TRIAR|nr:hypothetical protein TARUN_99 [Trichoderma arundinaceum]
MDLPPAPTPPVSGGIGPNSERTANLLNLLKFSGPGSSREPLQPSNQSQGQAQAQAQAPLPASSSSAHQQQQSLESPSQSQSQHQSQLQPQPSSAQQQQKPDREDNEEDEDDDDDDDDQYQRLQHLQMQSQNQFPTRIHQPAPAAADPTGLLAALMRGAHEIDEPKPAPTPPQVPAQPANPFAGGTPPADTRSYLLNLLNRPKPSQTDQPLLIESSRSAEHTPQSQEHLSETSSRYYGHHAQQQQQQQPPSSYHPQPLYQQQPADAFAGHGHANTNPIFSPTPKDPADVSVLYQALAGTLNQASPHSTSSVHGSAPPPFHILKKEQGSPAGSNPFGSTERSPLQSPPQQFRHKLDRASSLHSHQSHHSFQSHHSQHSHHSTQQSLKQTPPTSDFGSFVNIDKNRETVSEAVHDLAGVADRGAQEALDRAERETVSNYAESATIRPHDESDWVQPSNYSDATRSIEKHILEDSGSGHEHRGYGSSEEHLPKAAAELRDIDNHGIADSWESADQDEIVVIEEKEPPSVKVYNFPMKPWISITLQEDTTEPRPQFREESIMDVAHLKKDFDQIDRNLYTASQTYMTHGMSKQGGLRVIRQDDGKDAKVFRDTKDRIFNVAMSVTPHDYEGVPREAIIGTGISGTVYWVQIKDGEKDHLEDPHLEQYGFALPPINSQEGDAPGGALKTRARASTNHPEFFAVGRGKSIHFIWPSFILQNNLFKPGHDRVANTEALLSQCSLKINTGKAGKDFTFSQDDTVVVSLDKSGRVKFWDVRDLTAVKEGSDPRNPAPAHSSLEVKEPLMTLASTPEGEKAWPTSVLLLDKQRPYQKRCALRYMIVGMKQNHTLQLWDLALGKPVQEFNLPHSKESDAVCSVMYHPASGMIIIGHPTRNSVYFAHLSAPKYNLKSVSQAEYIQKLVTQDPSIPQPDSTAVISGVREYSFANRGILRSLDILANPAMVQDTDEPTLFELYAMHSKGVACLMIKQAELGWSKDNKVLDPVDAVDQGVVTVSKLKTPVQVDVTNGTTEHATPVRIVTRTVTREPVPPHASQAASSEAATPRGIEQQATTPAKPKNDAKEIETPGQSSKENHPEKPERKQRKKKGKDAEFNANGPAPSHKGEAAANKSVVNGLAAGSLSSEAFDSAISSLETRLGTAMSDTFKASLNNLHSKINDNARARDESFNQHQRKLLDMVSEILNENTEKVLEKLIHQQFTDVVIPSIGDKTSKAVADLIQNKLQANVSSSVQKEIQNALPHAVSRSLRSNDFINAISDRVSSVVSNTVQQDVLSTLTQRLAPTFTGIANQAAQRVAGDLHKQYHDQFEQMKAQHAADNNKIDQLLSYVTRLTDMVSTMAASQSSLQAEFLKFNKQPVELPVVAAAGGANVPHPASVAHSIGSHGYANTVASHRASFPQSQPPSQAPSHNQQYGSPQYMRGSQHMASPHGSAPPSEHVGPVNNVTALAGAYASQMNKTEAEADNDLLQRIRVIEQAIAENRLQDAMIQWIQSGRETDIFRRCLSRYPPGKFDSLQPLMLLVVIATISKDLKPNPRLKEEVEWIEMAVRAFGASLPNYNWDDDMSREVMKSTSQTMQLLINRVQPLIAGIQDGFPTDPFLANLERGKLEWIVRTSEHILANFY